MHSYLRIAKGFRRWRDGFFLRAESYFIATHSPILMAYPDALILQCGRDGIRPIACEDTDHFRVTRDFLAHRDVALKVLLER